MYSCMQELQGIGVGGPERSNHALHVLSELDSLGISHIYIYICITHVKYTVLLYKATHVAE